MDPEFKPIPGIWRFHAIYLVVTAVLGWAFFPYTVFASLFFVAGICILGLVLIWLGRVLLAHVLALAIGLATPVVVMARLVPYQTLLLCGLLIVGIFAARRWLF